MRWMAVTSLDAQKRVLFGARKNIPPVRDVFKGWAACGTRKTGDSLRIEFQCFASNSG